MGCKQAVITSRAEQVYHRAIDKALGGGQQREIGRNDTFSPISHSHSLPRSRHLPCFRSSATLAIHRPNAVSSAVSQ